MSKLQAALDAWDERKGYIWQSIPNEAFEAIATGMEAAKMWLDPNIEAAAKTYEEEWLKWWNGGRGLEAADPHEATLRIMGLAVAAALTPRDTVAPDAWREAEGIALVPEGDTEQTVLRGPGFDPSGDTDG